VKIVNLVVACIFHVLVVNEVVMLSILMSGYNTVMTLDVSCCLECSASYAVLS